MVVNLDILIFENFIVNFFILFITAQTLRLKLCTKLAVLASALASCYVITKLLPSLRFFTLVPFKIAVPLLIILITFRKKSVVFNIKATVIYMLYSMLLAGMCCFILFSSPSVNGFWGFIIFTYKKLFLSVMIIYIIINRLIIYIKERKEITQLIYLVDIFINKNKKSVRAFLDTGNELREPATNLPVIIVDSYVFKEIDFTNFDIFYIPYRVVDGTLGRLQGFIPDYITINVGGEVLKRNVVVACCKNDLSDLKDYQALLSRGII
ncbi:MAG: sigma-E processing peptidase SpoIIGA [Clostridiaceae bacterium]|nr:sigma-E processing peptidase SpoIIGA [Clostridiaceae bacterium]